MCTGKVFYGEKFDRIKTIDNGNQNNLQELSYSDMLKYPYLELEFASQDIYQCNFSTFYTGSSLNEYVLWSGKYQKQCFCEEFIKPANSKDGEWKY